MIFSKYYYLKITKRSENPFCLLIKIINKNKKKKRLDEVEVEKP